MNIHGHDHNNQGSGHNKYINKKTEKREDRINVRLGNRAGFKHVSLIMGISYLSLKDKSTEGP